MTSLAKITLDINDISLYVRIRFDCDHSTDRVIDDGRSFDRKTRWVAALKSSGLGVRDVDEGLRVAVDQRKPRALDLDHQPVAAAKGVGDIRHFKGNGVGLVGHERLRARKGCAGTCRGTALPEPAAGSRPSARNWPGEARGPCHSGFG